MAAPGGKFFIEDKLDVKAKHHESFEQLWETKWKKPVRSNKATPCTFHTRNYIFL